MSPRLIERRVDDGIFDYDLLHSEALTNPKLGMNGAMVMRQSGKSKGKQTKGSQS
ncbi:MAG: hypothetical protein ACXW3C_01290 [Pyrinomonadaceae bacterium]